MQGEIRPGATIVQLVVSRKLLEQFDRMVPPKSRSRVIETLMKRHVIAHQLENRLPAIDVEELVAWVE